MKDRQHSPDSPLLTLAMIVKDGGQDLASLLAEASPWVDEVVIGDTGSTDGSIEAALSSGARVIDVPWEDNFAAARNAVLEHCLGTWILCLDADERISKAGWAELYRWVADPLRGTPLEAVRLMTRNYLPGRHTRRRWLAMPDPDPHAIAEKWPPAPGFVPSAKVRLFPRSEQIRFAGRLHETVEASLAGHGHRIMDLPVPVHHFGSLAAGTGKPEYYLGLAREKAAEEAGNPTAWAELADCAIACGKHDEALAAIDRALVLDPADPDRRLTAGWLLLQSGRLDQADAHLAGVSCNGQIEDQILGEACHLRAQIALHQERFEAAGRLLSIALHLTPDNGHFLNSLGVWHLACGRGDQARVALERACVLLPGQAEPWLNLGKMYTAAGHPELARQSMEKAAALSGNPVSEAVPTAR